MSEAKAAWDNAFLPYPEVAVEAVYEGPLSELTLAVKDLFDVAGYPTGSGNAFELAASGIKTKTAPVVQTLLNAGARFVGKTYTDELAYSVLGRNVHFGSPPNARFPGFIAGGSSTGSAVAVSIGLADIGLGTDTSGSIRIPAALNGCVGWRPTRGLLDLAGCRPLAPSFDTAGLIVRNPDMLERAMAAFGVPKGSAVPLRLVVAEDMLEACDEDVRAGFAEAFSAAGLKPASKRALGGALPSELAEIFQVILWHEAAMSNAALLERRPGSIDPHILARLDRGVRVTDAELAEAHRAKAEFQAGMAARIGEDEALVFPTLPVMPPKVDGVVAEFERFRQKVIAVNCVAGLTGRPQIVLPGTGRSPIDSISVLSRADSDWRLCQFAKTMRLPR